MPADIRRLDFFRSFWRNRELWWRLTERDILGRYRGSALGIGWSVLTPLAMLGVYTFVFSQVFKARWGSLEEGGAAGFAANLFAGLIVFNLFSECAGKASSLIVSNPNYVKKVIFPLDILSWETLGTGIFHAGVSLVILIPFELFAFHQIPSTIAWLPLVWTPLLLGTIACTLVLSAAGVFLRDIGQVVSLLVNMTMFLSPIFFPISALPARWQPLLGLNPLGHAIEETRKVMIQGRNPSITYIITGCIAGVVACEVSYLVFNKSKKAFADVL
jgi:lipopolysaccharide transport system permease protein